MTRLTQLSRSIEGKVAMVTGAASGIGRATAHLFADEGAAVVVTDVNEEGVKRVVAEIEAAGRSARGWTLDVTDAKRVQAVVGEAVDRFGGIDILVNNAGASLISPILAEGFVETWTRAFEINLTAQMYLIRACLPHLARDGGSGGRIVNIASTEGLGATAMASPYTASKHGVVGLTRALAVELGSQGVTVNCVCPGPTRTGMTAPIPDDAKRKFARRRVPLRRYGEPEEVAHATLGLVLPAASFINGAVLVVDGGLIAQNTSAGGDGP
jgi:3-oxoacyl-[acyl-carrier protein] reductase